MKQHTLAWAAAASLAATLATAGVASAALYSQMDIGARGPQVTELQTFLAADPSIYPQGLVTGYFGSLTSAAVSRLQAAHGLPVVGRVGPMTIALVNGMMGGGIGGDTTAPTTGAITLDRRSDGVTFHWTGSEATRTTILYSRDSLAMTESTGPGIPPSISGSTATDGNLSVDHTVAIGNLSSGTTYHYAIVTVDAAGNYGAIAPQQTFDTK